ncbi:MAG: alpha/beta hydrolase [Gammaproteobacteria bacterium]|nr:MAG: alpha/beta hydrolase [Gammaproteobacteria bacterium]
MFLLRRRLERAGYRTLRFHYPSRRMSPPEVAGRLARLVQELGEERVHFVAHSLGGLVLRHLYHDRPQLPPGRAVTLGTPHQGSCVARELARRRPGRWLLGASIRQGLLGDLPPWPASRELGIIAGTLPLGLGRLICELPQPNDGAVSLEETHLPGASGHVMVRASHLGLLWSPRCARMCIEFLRFGRFLPQ